MSKNVIINLQICVPFSLHRQLNRLSSPPITRILHLKPFPTCLLFFFFLFLSLSRLFVFILFHSFTSPTYPSNGAILVSHMPFHHSLPFPAIFSFIFHYFELFFLFSFFRASISFIHFLIFSCFILFVPLGCKMKNILIFVDLLFFRLLLYFDLKRKKKRGKIREVV